MTKVLVALALTVTVCGSALADMSTFSFTQGDLSATATFETATGGRLVVTLFNTATVDVAAPEDVLTGLFFDITGFAGALMRESALLVGVVEVGGVPVGTPVLFPGNTSVPLKGYHNFTGGPGDGDIGSEAAYKTGASGVVAGTGDHAIGHVGMEDFLGIQWMGEVDLFDDDLSHDLQSPGSPNGIEYGIVNPGYTGGGNAPINGPNALVTTGVQYTFTGFGSFNASDITNVAWNYGTDFNPIPAPGAAGLGVIGLALMTALRRRL